MTLLFQTIFRQIKEMAESLNNNPIAPRQADNGSHPGPVRGRSRGSTVCPGCQAIYKNNARPPYCINSDCGYPIG